MKIKKYLADSMSEALQKVKDDLGPRAVLLNTRQVKKEGAIGILTKKKVEITAALDENPPPARGPVALPGTAQAPRPAQPSSTTRALSSTPSAGPAARQRTPSAAGETSESWAQRLSLDLQDLREALRVLTPSPDHRGRGALPLPGQLRALSEGMDYSGFSAGSISSCLERLLIAPGPGGFEDGEGLKRQAARFIAESLPPSASTVVKKGVRTVAAFVGTAGVGKTTAAAKIAAEFALREGVRVCLVAADVERVGGLDQIRALSEIIGVPLHVVYTPEEMARVIRDQRQMDLVLIDTAGVGPGERNKLEALRDMLREAAPSEVHLILGATADPRHMTDAAEAFRTAGVNRLLFTKLDETFRLGGVIDTAAQSKLPLSYLTNGRSVPGDIRAADPLDLALRAIK